MLQFLPLVQIVQALTVYSMSHTDPNPLFTTFVPSQKQSEQPFFDLF